nr:hypothetical protein [Rickettsiaceae bacterium]
VIASPTIDSIPQRQDFLQIFSQVDHLYAYTNWGCNYLKENGLNCLGSIGMGIDPNVMKPLNKKELRQKYRLPEDAIIFGFVARNQIRKRLPELIKAFSIYLKKAPADIAARSYLYLHTSSPDAGWNLATHLLGDGVINKVIFTYMCRKTGEIFCTTYKDDRTFSPFSGEMTAFLPNVVYSPSEDKLNEIYNLFDYYVQCSNCFTGETPILTIEGWKNIKDIKVGDMVYTDKKRFKKVTKLFNSHPKKILKITTFGNTKPLFVTDNHPMLAYTKNMVGKCRRSLREKLGDLARSNKNVDPEYTEVGNLQAGDMLVMSSEISGYHLPRISLDKYICDKDKIDGDSIIDAIDRKFNRHLELTPELCRFFGLFVADGYASNTKNSSVYITSNEKDTNNIRLSESQFQLFGDCKVSVSKYQERKAFDISINSKRHVNLFRDLFYTKDAEKQLPSWYMSIPLNLQKELLRGLFMGDGHFCENRGIKVSIFVTTSNVLAEQVKNLLINNNTIFNFRVVKKGGNRKNQYRFEITGADILNKEIVELPRGNSANVIYNNNYLLQIKSIEEVDCNEETYTMEVEEDHNYMTGYGFAMNCEGWGLPVLEAASSNVPVIGTDYSATKELVETFGGQTVPCLLNFDNNVMAERACIDPEIWSEALLKYALEKPVVNSRLTVLEKFTWTHIVDKVIEAIDKADPPKERWDAPIKQYGFPPIKGDMTATQFVHLLSSHTHLKWSNYNLLSLRSLNTQIDLRGKQLMMVSPETIAQRYQEVINKTNQIERLRCGVDPLPNEDYLVTS